MAGGVVDLDQLQGDVEQLLRQAGIVVSEAEFKEEMNGSDMDGWLYGGQPEDRPADIGYFFGYRIAQAYYNKADDKKAAIRDILLIEDFNEFLEASGYAP